MPMDRWGQFVLLGAALGVWVAGALLAWLVARLVARSISGGDNMVRLAAVARGVTFYGLLAVLLPMCLQIAGVPVSLSEALRQPIAEVAGKPLRVSNVAIALLLGVAGLVMGRVVSRAAGGHLLRRNVDATAAGAIQRLVFYVLLAAVVLTVLEELNIPMTSFAFLGGALAVGVGFGAQHIINNFISGWILLAERPVRIGDLVEVEGQIGRIAAIGARCTRVRRVDGIDVLVPNSKILENPVVNWTLVDDLVRGSVRVGVAYGSPVDRVREVIERAVGEQAAVLREPRAEVVFADFGDNAMIFDAYFWAHANGPGGVREIASEIRYRIEELCRREGIVLAFPQRDVHLDTTRPLEVRIATPDGPTHGD